MNDEVETPVEEFKKGRGGIVAAAVVAAAFIVFVAQNGRDEKVTWLFFDGTAPLWTLIIVAAVAGALLSALLGFMWRRRGRR